MVAKIVRSTVIIADDRIKQEDDDTRNNNDNDQQMEELLISENEQEQQSQQLNADAVADIAETAAAILLQYQNQDQLEQNQDQNQVQVQLQQQLSLPQPLPVGWVLRESRTHPNYYYYYNQETGVSTWEPEWIVATNNDTANDIADAVALALSLPSTSDTSTTNLDDIATAAAAALANNNNNTSFPQQQYDTGDPSDNDDTITGSTGFKREINDTSMSSVDDSNKRIKTTTSVESSSTTINRERPSKVRVLHILKKHKDARRPSSWRRSVITISKEEAIEELQGIFEIIQDEISNDPTNFESIRATFEELARTESDCSSAKRGGDLGYFGPKKMQPTFEETSFQLNINELSTIIETSSGVHIILRIG